MFGGDVFVAWSRDAVSPRRKRLPADWERRRRVVLERDKGVCQWRLGEGICGVPATDVDHIVPNDDDSFLNLRALCRAHHMRKTGGEGNAARARLLREVKARFRRSELHPAFGGDVGA